ncbi:hypothetical protein TNCV_2585091 [Trichonephila clavipes]|nr:hypothetical protein TNCV_2585091 [Trichonephila clavipes]
MFKNCRKEDLRIVALELGETVAEKVTIVELTEIIKENKYFKEDVEFVKELIQYTIEDHTYENSGRVVTSCGCWCEAWNPTQKVPNRPSRRPPQSGEGVPGREWAMAAGEPTSVATRQHSISCSALRL